MVRTVLMLLLLALGSVAGFGQVPGYLGKRLTLQGEFHSLPAIGGPTAANRGFGDFYGEEGGGFGLNWSAGARIGYAVSRLQQVVGSFDYLKTGMIQTAYSPATGFLGETGYDTHYMFYNITGLTAGIGMRKFRSSKGALAPMGMYSGYSLNVTYLKGKVLDKQTSYAFFGPEHAPIGTDPKHFLLSAGYEFGNNIVIKDRILLNVGAKLNFALSPRALQYALSEEGPWYPGDGTDKSYEDGNTENFKALAATRYALHSLFMIYVGVGLIQ